MYFLDSNTCIYFLNGRFESVRDQILKTSPKNIKIASIVQAELLLGAYKSQHRQRTLQKVENFLSAFEIVPFSEQSSYHYAEIRTQTERTGQLVGANDLLIAAIVKQYQAVLVTNNTKKFQRIHDLKLQNWTEN